MGSTRLNFVFACYQFLVVGRLGAGACAFMLPAILFSCSKSSIQTIRPELPVGAVDTTPVIESPVGWRKSDLPGNRKIYGLELYLLNRNDDNSFKAACLAIDPLRVSFNPVLVTRNKTLAEIYKEQSGKIAAINGGYFGSNVSYSLVKSGGRLMSDNIRSLNRVVNGISDTYYPTRGAFGISSSGVPEIKWVYTLDDGRLFAYPHPSLNTPAGGVRTKPGVLYPANGVSWDVLNAIGGSPVLVYDGQVRITADEELINIDNDSRRARSAIGYTADGKVLLVAVQGDDVTGNTGVDLQGLAELMLSLRCKAALNLDGGGSTSMVVGEEEVISPSGNSARGIMSAIILKK